MGYGLINPLCANPPIAVLTFSFNIQTRTNQREINIKIVRLLHVLICIVKMP